MLVCCKAYLAAYSFRKAMQLKSLSTAFKCCSAGLQHNILVAVGISGSRRQGLSAVDSNADCRLDLLRGRLVQGLVVGVGVPGRCLVQLVLHAVLDAGPWRRFHVRIGAVGVSPLVNNRPWGLHMSESGVRICCCFIYWHFERGSSRACCRHM